MTGKRLPRGIRIGLPAVVAVFALGLPARVQRVEDQRELQEQIRRLQEAERIRILMQQGAGMAAPIPPRPTAQDQALANIDRDDLEILAFDDFEDVLSLEWDVLNRARSHYSLEKKRGALTIWTQHGTFSHTYKNYKNLFLFDVPEAAGDNYQITTCVSDFHPKEDRNQASVVCFCDEDNFLLLNYEIVMGRNSFTIVHERNGLYQPLHHPNVEQGLATFWLRITKWGSRYVFSKSTDGKRFDAVRALTWNGPALNRVGLTAKNGSGIYAPEVAASFEFFELAGITAKTIPEIPKPPAGQPAAGPYAIRAEALRIPPNLQPCANNLHSLYTALKKYERAKGALPTHLSDLVPGYLAATKLICPVHPVQQPGQASDPKLPCSYGYQYSDTLGPYSSNETYRETKDRERKTYGDLVPLVRCYHPNDQVLNLTFNGRIYSSGLSTWMQALVRREE